MRKLGAFLAIALSLITTPARATACSPYSQEMISCYEMCDYIEELQNAIFGGHTYLYAQCTVQGPGYMNFSCRCNSLAEEPLEPWTNCGIVPYPACTSVVARSTNNINLDYSEVVAVEDWANILNCDLEVPSTDSISCYHTPE